MSSERRAHICNIFFEKELESWGEHPLTQWMDSHPVVRQLQTLPLLYAPKEDLVLVTQMPQNPDPRLRLINASKEATLIESWGASRAIDLWAEEHAISYSMPPWGQARQVQSKMFSFSHSPRLPLSALLYDEKEVMLWIEKTPEPKVLKTPFGHSGVGHFHIPGRKNLSAFLNQKKFPLIGEPWVKRIFDFSTQWKNGQLLGATALKNTPEGIYQTTLVGPKIFASYEWALEEHINAVQPLLQTIQAIGFFGHLGIDAFVYEIHGKQKVQSVVEINARKTMSWVALQIQQMQSPETQLRFSFSPKTGINISWIN